MCSQPGSADQDPFFEGGGDKELHSRVLHRYHGYQPTLLDSRPDGLDHDGRVDVTPVDDRPVLYSLSPFIDALEQDRTDHQRRRGGVDTEIFDPLNGGNRLYTSAA